MKLFETNRDEEVKKISRNRLENMLHSEKGDTLSGALFAAGGTCFLIAGILNLYIGKESRAMFDFFGGSLAYLAAGMQFSNRY